MSQRTIAILGALLLVACARSPDGGALLPKSYDGTLLVRPDPVAFEDTRAGCVRSRTLELRNTSPDLSLVVTNVDLPDPSLSLGQELPIRLEAGGHRELDLHFTPESPGSRSVVAKITTDEGKLYPYELPIRATAVARPVAPADAAPAEPLDLVLVLDVSTTMNELADLRAALQGAFDRVESRGADVRFGLTTFENGVRVHRGGAFLEREAFFEELDSQLVSGRWVPDPDQPRQLLNFDFPENALDALGRSAVEFEFRPGARRRLLLMTDDTFLDPPEVFSDGTPVLYAYDEVARELEAHEIRLYSVHDPLRGRGLSSSRDGEPALVARTGGAWFEISDVDRGTLALGPLLLELISGRTCPSPSS